MIVLSGATDAADARQWPSGSVSVLFDYLPERDHTAELRSRLYAEKQFELPPHLRIMLSGFAEGLFARREAPPPAGTSGRRAADAILELDDAYVVFTTRRLDILVGHATTVWGRLDELQPTDVVNPLDASRFFFEGRGEARLPVGMLRARVFLSEHATLEGVFVPVFRRGRFDRLEESTSPFNLAATASRDSVGCQAVGCPAPPRLERERPAVALRNAQGGARIAATTGRVDWSVSAYRGLEPVGILTLDPAREAITETYPRFTMLGADFETVSGPWGIRGEAAVFPEDTFQSPEGQRVPGRSFDAGFGFDRRAGAYTVSGTVLVHSESYDPRLTAPAPPGDGRFDVSLIASADRTFARERYRLRAFGVYNASQSSGFIRAIGRMNLQDNVTLEGSVGWFAGQGEDLIGRFSRNDFAYLRWGYHF
jgi:hypothetical protein